ncbi:MAG TPA: helix-turn-helix domain-containing protein [Pedobacter sp.]|nr:helix-turn-helix domain-containing protein [Pedobacter sp.]
MNYQQYQPPECLRDYVRYFWSFDAREPSHRTLCIRSFADRFPRLIFQDLSDFRPLEHGTGYQLPQCYISGIDTKDTWATLGGSWSHFGVSFYPHALKVFFQADADDLTDEMPEILLLCKSQIGQQLEVAKNHLQRMHLLSDYLYQKLWSNRKPERFINHIIHSNAVLATSSLYQLQKDLKISERQLERDFKRCVGISPKKFQRIIRFERALDLLSTADYRQLTSVAYQLGYYDQAHFIKDFSSFSGMSPYQFTQEKKMGSESSSFIYDS